MKSKMMMMMLGLGVLTIAAPSFAEEAKVVKKHKKGERIQKRIQNQEKRIEEGVKSGKLTEDQAKKLQQNVDTIKSDAKSAAESDGKMTKEEREKLRGELKSSSKAIHDAKHPNAVQPAVPAGPAGPAMPVAPSTGQ